MKCMIDMQISIVGLFFNHDDVVMMCICIRIQHDASSLVSRSFGNDETKNGKLRDERVVSAQLITHIGCHLLTIIMMIYIIIVFSVRCASITDSSTAIDIDNRVCGEAKGRWTGGH